MSQPLHFRLPGSLAVACGEDCMCRTVRDPLLVSCQRCRETEEYREALKEAQEREERAVWFKLSPEGV